MKTKTKPRRIARHASSSRNGCVRKAAKRPQKTSRLRLLDESRHALPTELERDTLLTPEWVAESVVQEVERFLHSSLPDNFAERLAARAYYLYPRHKYFHQGINRPGNRGRDNLYMFMRHWTAGWLKRERFPLYQQLPRSFSLGQPLVGIPKRAVVS